MSTSQDVGGSERSTEQQPSRPLMMNSLWLCEYWVIISNSIILKWKIDKLSTPRSILNNWSLFIANFAVVGFQSEAVRAECLVGSVWSTPSTFQKSLQLILIYSSRNEAKTQRGKVAVAFRFFASPNCDRVHRSILQLTKWWQKYE